MSAAATVNPLADVTAMVAVVDQPLRRQVTEALAKTSARLLDDTFESGDIEELASSVQRLRPAILLLGLLGVRGDASAAVAKMAGLEFAPRVIAVSSLADPEVILKAMRAGALEFLYPPLEPGFEPALQSVMNASRTAPDVAAAGKLIAFASVKGGCGATTLACHSANWLRNTGKKEVLLADLDLAAGIADALMQSAAKYTLDDALNNLHRLDLKLWKAVVATSPCGVDVIAAPPEPPIVVPISRKLAPMLRFWRMHYEFTLIDLGHGLTPTLFDVLSSIDTLVLVTTSEIPALRRARQMVQSLAAREFGANRVKLVLNRTPRHAAIGMQELEKIMGVSIHSVITDDPRDLREACSYPRLVEPNSGIATQFGAFAAKIAGLTAPTGKVRKLFRFRQEN